jgi:hypothetical protein
MNGFSKYMTKTKTIANAPIIRFDQVSVIAHEKTILSAQTNSVLDGHFQWVSSYA